MSWRRASSFRLSHPLGLRHDRQLHLEVRRPSPLRQRDQQLNVPDQLHCVSSALMAMTFSTPPNLPEQLTPAMRARNTA